MSLLLEARNVSKSYGVFQALENVNMTVSENELVSVVGPNGAGKTTLVNLFTGLLSPTQAKYCSWAKYRWRWSGRAR